MFGYIAALTCAVLIALALVAVSSLFIQGRRKPDTTGAYVALGSSFAAGLGLGPAQPGSPAVCMRSAKGYPQELARLTDLRLVDMTCSGSSTGHILHGGQVFLGPQISAVGPEARLVTITSGGNDVSYISDLTLASGRAGLFGKLLWRGPRPVGERDFARVSQNFESIVREVRRRAPSATVVLVSYPAILPPSGTCLAVGVDAQTADLVREVAAGLRNATEVAAQRTGALFVDMDAVGVGHDACSSRPWVNGAHPSEGAPFHPTVAGAKATAQAIARAVMARHE